MKLILALIAAGPGIIAAVFAGIGMVMGILNSRAIKAGHDQVTEVKVALDGRLEELLKSAHAEGRVEEQALADKRQADKDARNQAPR